MLTEEAVGSLMGRLSSLPPSDATEEPESLEVLRVAESPDVRKRTGCTQGGWCPIWSKNSPEPAQRAGLACLVAPEICVKRS